MATTKQPKTLNDLIAAAGLTTADIARRMKTHVPNVSLAVHGRRVVSEAWLARLAGHLEQPAALVQLLYWRAVERYAVELQEIARRQQAAARRSEGRH